MKLIMEKNKYKFEFTTRIIDFQGYNIQTYSWGNGKRPIFAFPPFPNSGLSYIWFFNHYDLDKVKVITFDLPGWIGYSENIFKAKDFELNEIIDIAIKIIKEYKIDDFDILGYSFGSALAVMLNNKCQNKVHKLLIVSPIVNSKIIKGFYSRYFIPYILKLKLSKIYKFKINRFIKKMSKNVWLKDNAPINYIQYIKDMIKFSDSCTILKSVNKLFQIDLSEEINLLKSKDVLVINSVEEDKNFQMQADFIRKKIKNNKSIYLYGNHIDFVVKPDRKIVKKVVEFFNSK